MSLRRPVWFSVDGAVPLRHAAARTLPSQPDVYAQVMFRQAGERERLRALVGAVHSGTTGVDGEALVGRVRPHGH